MNGSSLPSVFVSHGAPTIVTEDSAVRNFLGGLGDSLGRPQAVLCVSAHWETTEHVVSVTETPETLYDFYGFADPLYELSYPAPGAPALAKTVSECLADANIPVERNALRGLDHGAWVPLMLMYPAADIPVCQLSVQPDLGAEHHYRLGRALEGLRHQGVLVLGSGGAVHNLEFFRPGSKEVPDWAQRFEDWLVDRVEAGAAEKLIDYRNKVGAMAHPRDEHYLPLLTALGAGGENAKGRALHRGFMDGALSMAAFTFG